MWLIFLILGLLISLQANFIRPEYFPKGFSLFPTWPQQDPVLATCLETALQGPMKSSSRLLRCGVRE
jgi:membrane glycosyltransferase